MAEEQSYNLERLNDRAAVIVNAAGEKFVTFGDGKTLPFGVFMREEVFNLVSVFLGTPSSNVTLLDSAKLTGLVGALLARQSRAHGSVVDILAKEFLKPDGTVNREKAEALIHRVLIQFGDDSVQELECATVLFTSISNLATKKIEDRRLGSYIEQSSRYVVYTERDPVSRAWRYAREPRIMASAFAKDYERTMDAAFDLYARLSEMLTSYYASIKPLQDAEYAIRPDEPRKLRWLELRSDDERKEFERVYKTDLKTRACDTARVVLPAATLTNMAMVANGRTYEYLLKVLYSADIPEFSDIAERLHSTLNRIIPQYVKRALPAGDEFLRDLRVRGLQIAATYPELNNADPSEEVKLIDLPNLLAPGEEAQIHLLAAALYPHSRVSYGKIVESIKNSRRNYVGLIGHLAGGRKNRRDRSPRAFELGYPVNAEVVCDFGAYRDLHRHRMLTLERQALTPYLGFAMPDDIIVIGMGNEVAALAEAVSALYKNIEKEINADAAEYCVLFGHKLRFRIGMNLREAQHLLELRTVAQGHPNYRRVAQKICKEIFARAPWLAETGLLKFVDWNEYNWARADAEAKQSQKTLGLDGK